MPETAPDIDTTWRRHYDSEPCASVDPTTTYRGQTTTDGGATWQPAGVASGRTLRMLLADAATTGSRITHTKTIYAATAPPTGRQAHSTITRWTPTTR